MFTEIQSNGAHLALLSFLYSLETLPLAKNPKHWSLRGRLLPACEEKQQTSEENQAILTQQLPSQPLYFRTILKNIKGGNKWKLGLLWLPALVSL